MKIYGKYLLVSLIWGICFSLITLTKNDSVYSLQSLVIHIGLHGYNACNQITMMDLLEKMVPYYIFMILFGTYIYRHFCWCSPYIFSRCENRKKWIYKEMGKLFLFSFLYIVCMVIGRMIPIMIRGSIYIDKIGIIMLILLLGIMTLWLFSSSLFCNILSICKESIFGTMLTLIIHIILVFQMMFIDTINFTNAEILKLRLNYCSHLVFSWHSFPSTSIEGMNQLGANISFIETYLYLVVVAILIMVIGIFIIEKKDIIINMEEK